MGAVCGFAALKNNLVSVENLGAMSRTLSHRGPDHESYYFENGVGLAFRALKSETFCGDDISETKDDNVFIAFDGDLYNLEELQKEVCVDPRGLNKPTFRILSDAYRKFGVEFIEKLNGQFSIVLLDRLKNLLILGRDQSGQKPLYYVHSNGLFAFASELKALTSLQYIDKELDLEGLYWYLAGGYITSPRSIYQKIFKLPEGTLLIYNLNDQTVKQVNYDVEIEITQNSDDVSEEVLAEELDQLLTDVISEQVSRISGPIACFLSGGVDTSLILSLLKKVTDKNIKTFTIGFEDPLCDERPYARKVAEYFNVENYEYVISENDFIDATQNLIDLFDEPFADIGVTTAFQASKLAKKHADVVFSGDGADFLFGNYDFKYLYLFYKILPNLVRKPVVLLLDVVFDNAIVKKKFPNMPIRSYLGEKGFFEAFFIKWKKDELRRLLGFEVDTQEGKFYKVFINSPRRSLSDRILEAQYKTYGIDCVDTKSERTVMANSLHVINPYLDRKVIEFAKSLPPHLKFKKGYGKYLPKKVLYKYVPPEYFDRPKRGSGIPFGNLTDKGMRLFISQYLNSERLKKEGIFKDIKIIEQNIDSYRSGDYFTGHKLWALIIFEIWLEKNCQVG